MPPKYHEICDDLVKAIRSGVYQTGDQLPSYREIAGIWQVSYVTASKALNRLAEKNYVDLDHGKGTFVRWRGETDYLATRKVTLCIPTSPAFEHPVCQQVATDAQRQLEALDWDVEVFRPNSVEQAIERVRDTSTYTLWYGYHLIEFRSIYDLCAAGRERLVVIGERYDRFGIACACVDISQEIHLAMNHLRERGKHRIGYLCSNLRHGGDLEGASAWASIASNIHEPSDLSWRDYLMNWNMPQGGNVQEGLVQYLAELDDRGVFRNLDAIISTDDTKAVVTAGYLHDQGIRVPEDIAIVTINDSPLATMVRPQLTTIDICLSDQISQAVDILEEKVTGQNGTLSLRLCQPKLIVRQSS